MLAEVRLDVLKRKKKMISRLQRNTLDGVGAGAGIASEKWFAARKLWVRGRGAAARMLQCCKAYQVRNKRSSFSEARMRVQKDDEAKKGKFPTDKSAGKA
jgi:hypothetical protein